MGKALCEHSKGFVHHGVMSEGSTKSVKRSRRKSSRGKFVQKEKAQKIMRIGIWQTIKDLRNYILGSNQGVYLVDSNVTKSMGATVESRF